MSIRLMQGIFVHSLRVSSYQYPVVGRILLLTHGCSQRKNALDILHRSTVAFLGNVCSTRSSSLVVAIGHSSLSLVDFVGVITLVTSYLSVFSRKTNSSRRFIVVFGEESVLRRAVLFFFSIEQW